MKREPCDPTDLIHRAIRLIESVNNQLSDFARQPVTVSEILLGTTHERLRAVPINDLDATLSAVTAHIKKHGDCGGTAFGQAYALSEVAIQMRSTLEQVASYRPLLKQLEVAA